MSGGMEPRAGYRGICEKERGALGREGKDKQRGNRDRGMQSGSEKQ